MRQVTFKRLDDPDARVAIGTRLAKAFEDLRSSLWFVPTLMTIAAFALSVLALRVDVLYRLPDDAWYVFSGGPAGAGSVLSTIAGSMIGVTGVTFSITVVALSLASQQFGPRLLRNFMRDRSNQVVLGTFIATFVFCLLGLQAIDRTAEINEVPRLTVSIGFGLALASLAVLIYFIHHITRSIQAETVIANVSRELHAAVEKLYPSKLGIAAPPDEGVHRTPREDGGENVETGAFPSQDGSFTLESRVSGYLEAVDEDAILDLAVEHDLVFEILRRPGEFVPHGRAVLRAWPGRRVDDDLADRLAGVLVFGSRKTPQQDVAFVFEQLVEIAVRSLSPGVNDPYTAIAAIERLGDGLAHLAKRRMPSPNREDDQGRLRLVVARASFADVLDLVFDPIRRYGAKDAAVALSLLGRAGDVAAAMRRGDPRVRRVAEHAARVHRQATEAAPAAHERLALDAAYRRVLAIGDRPSSNPTPS